MSSALSAGAPSPKAQRPINAGAALQTPVHPRQRAQAGEEDHFGGGQRPAEKPKARILLCRLRRGRNRHQCGEGNKQHDHQALEVEFGLKDMRGCINGIKAGRTYVKHGSDASGRELRIELLRRELQKSELLEIEIGRNRAQQKQRQFDEEKRDDGVLKRNAASGQRCRRRQTLADERRYRHCPQPQCTEWAPIPAKSLPQRGKIRFFA